MTPLSRRNMLGAMAATALAATFDGRAMAQTSLGGESFPLWPGHPPGSPATPPREVMAQQSKDPSFNDRWLSGVAAPALTVRRPVKPNGAAALIVPGGSYSFLSIDNEGEEQARWLTAQGVTCFILTYRLPGEGWADRAHAPLQDAQRAMRLIRAKAADYGVDPTRIAVLGFSAGGHLAGSLATRHGETLHAPIDAADQLSARPDLAGLIYPVVTLSADCTHIGSRNNLLGADASEEARRAASVELGVTADTPPIFLAHAGDDGLVPVANSILLYQAMIAAQRDSELHCFDRGGHGFGVRLPRTLPASAWPDLFAAYGRRVGVFAA